MDYHKILTSHLPITTAPETDTYIFPVSQHIGKPAVPVVIKGEKVKVGQLIAKAEPGCSANIHSSVSGEVMDIKDSPHSSGVNTKCIIIKNDNQYTKIKTSSPKQLKDMTKSQLIQMVEDCGIVGLGGATFPTVIKIKPGKPVEELIINGAECEPYLTADHRLMVEYTHDIFVGIEILQKILEPKKTFIGVEDNKPDAILSLKKALIRHNNIQIVSLPTKYPQGAEKILVKQITKKRIKKLPIDKGVVVINVATAAQIGKSFETGMPLIDRIVTISGEEINKHHNYLVRIGTPISVLLPELKKDLDKTIKVISGGPMMGVSQHNLDIPVTKGTSGIIVIKNVIKEEGTCSRCAKCIDNCPLSLMPILAAKKGIQAMDCMECGLCAYNCPCNINLVQRIRLQKIEIMKKGKAS